MSKPIPVACPKCGAAVHVAASAGGRGTNDLTSYSADCDECGMLIDHLGDAGRRDNAIRDYNRWAREYVAPVVGKHSITVRSGYGAYDSVSAPESRHSVGIASSQSVKSMREVSTDEQSRQRRMKNFAVRAEPTPEPDFVGEKTIYVTKNGRQEYPTSLAPHEAQKLFDLLRVEFNLS
jgi:hypothetical protein